MAVFEEKCGLSAGGATSRREAGGKAGIARRRKKGVKARRQAAAVADLDTLPAAGAGRARTRTVRRAPDGAVRLRCPAARWRGRPVTRCDRHGLQRLQLPTLPVPSPPEAAAGMSIDDGPRCRRRPVRWNRACRCRARSLSFAPIALPGQGRNCPRWPLRAAGADGVSASGWAAAGPARVPRRSAPDGRCRRG